MGDDKRHSFWPARLRPSKPPPLPLKPEGYIPRKSGTTLPSPTNNTNTVPQPTTEEPLYTPAQTFSAPIPIPARAGPGSAPAPASSRSPTSPPTISPLSPAFSHLSYRSSDSSNRLPGYSTGNIYSMAEFDRLPEIRPEDRPKVFRDGFGINVNFVLCQPKAIHLICPECRALRLAHTSSVVYISPFHSHYQIMDQMVTTAVTLFGLDMTDKSRWRYSCEVDCQGLEGSIQRGSFEWVVSASREGDWKWTVYVIEVQKNRRGRWSSIQGAGVPTAGDGTPDEAPANTGREV